MAVHNVDFTGHTHYSSVVSALLSDATSVNVHQNRHDRGCNSLCKSSEDYFPFWAIR